MNHRLIRVGAHYGDPLVHIATYRRPLGVGNDEWLVPLCQNVANAPRGFDAHGATAATCPACLSLTEEN